MMAGLEGGGKRGKARGGGAIPRVTESGGMWRWQPASRACGSSLPFQRASPLPKMLSGEGRGELCPFLSLTLLPAGGLATYPERLGWRPGSPRPRTVPWLRLLSSPLGAAAGSVGGG